MIGVASRPAGRGRVPLFVFGIHHSRVVHPAFRDCAQEEELERRAQAQAKQEQQEYDEWKGMFAVEEGGSVEDQIASESQGLLGEFVQYIERRKTVVLEELAAHFGLRTQDVIHRVHALESASP